MVGVRTQEAGSKRESCGRLRGASWLALMSSVSPHARRVSFSTQPIPRTGTPRLQSSHSVQTSEREARPRTASQVQQPATPHDATMQTALDVLLVATALKLLLFPA